MRTFIAIELPKEIKTFLVNIQETLKKSNADVKWVTPENIHLTLKFLGERDKKKVDEIIKVMQDAASNTPPFQFELFNTGAFPKKEFPKVIWVGLSKGDAEIRQLAERLDNEICKLGLPKETHPFSSHITLGRVRSLLNKKQLIEQLDYLEGNFPGERPVYRVERIALLKSTLTPQGPIYEILKEASLKAI